MLEPLANLAEAQLKSFLIWLLEGLCLGLWYVQKVCAWLAEQVIGSAAWEAIVTNLLDSVAAVLPDALQSVLFGTGGGLFYLALIGVSLVLVVPHLVRRGHQPVQLERVLGWSLVVVALFTASTAGYDALAQIEGLRMQMVSDLASGWGGGSVADFVARPMSASAAEINVTDLALPATFEATYFPAPTSVEVVEIVFYDAPLIGTNSSTVTIETDESLTQRTNQASLAIVLTILNLIPTAMVVILALTFAALTASALVLLLFFLMALPLGLFEVGGTLLGQIATRYLLIWALSLFISLFPALLLGVAELTLTPPVTMPDLFTYMAILIVAVMAVHHVAKWVYHVATDSFAAIGQTVNATLAPHAYGLTPPTPSQYTDTALSAVGGVASATILAGGTAVNWLGQQLDQRQQDMDISPTAAPSAAPPQTLSRPHVFAYLDDPSYIDGEYEEIELPPRYIPETIPTMIEENDA